MQFESASLIPPDGRSLGPTRDGSVRSQHLRGIDAGRAVCRLQTRNQCHGQHQCKHDRKGQRIGRLHAVECGADEACGSQGGCQPKGGAQHGQAEALAHDHESQVGAARAQRQTHTKLVHALADAVGEHAGLLLNSFIRLTQSIGPYQIRGVIGEGGMGVVYLAERADLGSSAAIKILRDAWLSPARRDRFASEQRTLAQLSHPCITRLFDADTLPDGTPYLVMEYVEGVPNDVLRYA